MAEDGGFVIEERYSPWQKKKVRAFLVNARSKIPAQRSIANAVNIAKPYDRIELTGGEYNESVTVSFPLEIVAGEGEEPHIISRNSGITFTANVEGYLENLVITSKGNSRLDAAVVVMSGSPVVFRCNVNSVIVGGTGTPTIEKCSITESSSGFGLIVQDSGGGTVTGTNIFYHTNACVDVDTKGELLITQCNLHNCKLLAGDVMRVSATASAAAAESEKVFPACSHVEVSKCQIYINDEDPNVGRMKQRQIPQVASGVIRNSVGTCCCVVVSSNARPTFSSNEFLEGEIGFLFDDSGAAVVRGNIIRCQRRTGVLALVEEGYSYIKGRQSLRITGDNVLDRCLVGIDVQCITNRSTMSVIPTEDKIISTEYPIPKRAFRWINNPRLLEDAAGEKASPFEEGKSQTVIASGAVLSLAALRDQIRRLAQLTLQLHTTCLSPQFTYGTTSGISFAPTGPSNGAMTSTDKSAFANVLNSSLGTTLSSELCDKSPSAALVEQVLQLRGNQGVDIERTKFSSCGLCAIRFGRQGYGLVEDCTFDNCGSHAVVIESAAHPLITGCRFMRSNDAGILVGNYANPFIIGNEIAQGRVNGIDITGQSMGLIVGNAISGNQGTGVSLHSGSSTIICANMISVNRGGGVKSNSSSPIVLLNSFSGNAEAQVGCTECSDAVVGFNSIQSSQHVGVLAATCSRCTVLQNDISMNGEGMVVELDADPIVEGNKICRNIRVGVRTVNNGIGSFVNNEISENNGPNVLVLEGASPNFRMNSIRKSSQGGVVVAQEGRGRFEKNTIAENSIANVIVTDQYSQPVFVSNSMFLSASGCGVVCGRDSEGVFLKNKISENRACGVYVFNGANPKMQGNDISRESVGVIISDNGKGVFTKNIVESCFGSGIISQHGGDANFSENIVRRCGGSGLLVTAEGRGTFTDNDLYENGVGVQNGCGTETAPFVFDSPFLEAATPERPSGSRQQRRSNSVFSPSGQKSYLQNFVVAAGTRRATVTKPTVCLVRACKIHHNKSAGVLIDLDASALLQENDIHDNAQYGVLGDSEFCTEWAKKTIQESAGSSPFSPVTQTAQRSPPSSPVSGVLVANRIHSHSVANVYFIRLSTTVTVFRANEIFDAPIGVYIGNYSNITLMEGNTIRDCLDGVYGESGGAGEFVGNRIVDCRYTGVYVSDFAEPTWGEKNTVERCGICGIMVDAGGRGRFSRCTVRHCAVGVMVFSGATAPFHTSYEEIVKANLVSSYATFDGNTIEENESHGVLVVTVLSGCPLRVSRKQMEEEQLGEFDHYKPRPSDGGVKVAHAARSEQLCTSFSNNTISRNRLFGVFMDQFEHWDLDALDKAHAEQKTNRTSSMPNAYGGYEVLLGTSQVLDSEDHQKERAKKQVTFTGNTISECSFGFGAGYGCHPFLRKNKVVKNAFFGLFLRFGSAVMAHGCDIGENGIAGIYAALGAKGFVTRGSIFSNNGFSRSETKRSTARNFSEFAFSQRFLPPPSEAEENSLAQRFDASTLFKASRAYEQMGGYIGVVSFLMTKGIRTLCEMVSASSDAMSLGSGCVPSAAAMGPTSVLGTLGMAGLTLPNYVKVCPADGGLGVWIEDDARTTIKDNVIRDHRNYGVFVSKGVSTHHRVLSNAIFSVKPISVAAGKVDIMDSTNDYLAQPALACAEPYVLFSPFSFCASGVVAALQVATMYAAFDYGGDNLATSMTTGGATPRTSPGKATDTNVLESKDQKLDSIHFSHVLHNTITGNRNGVGIELYHLLNATAALGLPPVAALSTSAPSHEGGGAMVDSTGALLDLIDFTVMEPITEALDYTVVLDQNKIHKNAQYGVFCQHVVQVYCGAMIADAGELAAQVRKQYDISLASYGRQKPTYAFVVAPVTRKTNHAMVSKNDISDNGSYQTEITSRYVAITEDRTFTLLQYDTMATPDNSQYSSQVLLGTSVLGSLTQLPPPGVLVLEGNKIHDCERGVHVCGVLGSRSVRLSGNYLSNITGTALLSEGHMSCVTVGAGNVFDSNGIAIDLRSYTFFTEPSASHQPLSVRADRRTRVFQNTIKASKSVGISMNTAGCGRVLFFQNELTEHGPGSTSFLLNNGETSGTVLHGNTFRDSFAPVIISNSSSGSALLSENYYTGNYIGALICNGAAPLLQKELFEGNTRSGLEVVGAHTRPTIENCVFRNHIRAEDSATTAAAARYTYPHDGVVSLVGQPRLQVHIEPENCNILGPNSSLRLPAGLLLGPDAEGSFRNCAFLNNDLGIDAVRGLQALSKAEDGDTVAGGGSVASRQSRFQTCFFRANRVAGVLTRGLGKKALAAAAAAASAKSTQAEKSSTAAAAVPPAQDSGESSAATEHTVFEKCFFVNNRSEELCGDVITMANGYAVFRKNVLCGTVHARFDGLASFVENSFFPYETAPSPHTALVCHQGSKVSFSHNSVVQRKVGVFASPGSGGLVRENNFIQCVTGISLAPFCTLECHRNRIFLSEDCAVLAFGGTVAENEIFKAPTGVIIQNPYTYKGINAIPDNMRKNPEIHVRKNTVSGCAADGVLVAGVGVVEGNIVTKCRNGVTVVSGKSTDGVVGASAKVKENNVFDNVVGINIDDKAACLIESNDVFDNDSMGVICNVSATGELRGNRISSAGDQGAVDIPLDSQIKANSNVIRNQFSPAYNRGIRSNRLKEYSTKAESIFSEVEGYTQLMTAAENNAEALAHATDTLIQDLLMLHMKAANVQSHAGAIATSLRRASGAVAFPSVEVKTIAEVASSPTGKGAGRRLSAVSPSHTSKVSNTATMARKKVSTGRKESLPPVHALIHILSDTGVGAATALGHTVAQVFATPPMSRMNLTSSVTTSSTQLSRALATHHPSIVLVVLDVSYVSKVTDADRAALAKLSSFLTERQGGAMSATFVLLPQSCSLQSPELTCSDGGMSVATFAGLFGIVVYRSGVDDALGELKRELAAEIKRQGSKHPESTLVDESESLGNTVEVAGDAIAGLSNASPVSALWGKDRNEGDGAIATTERRTTFTRDYIGGLLSQLTPEALGIKDAPTADDTTTPKKRKTSGKSSKATSTKKRSNSLASGSSRKQTATGQTKAKRKSIKK